ncbi:MAG: 50S ribosomal protein L22 [Chloroflexi bacterium]|nr:50S ribosomal protein L22 [Chloroflexota bacterium]
MEVRAVAKSIGVSPLKVRRLLDLVRGQRAEQALGLLRYMPSPSAKLVAKVVRSAIANAENNYQIAPADLRIVRIFADEGPTMKRFRASAKGRARPILRRSSHITVVVAEE